MAEIQYPFGPADVATLDASTGTVALTIDNQLTIRKFTAPAGAVTITAEVEEGVKEGAELVLHVAQGATGRNFTLSTGFGASAPDLTGVANDVDVISLVYDGTSFIPKSTWQKVVDAA